MVLWRLDEEPPSKFPAPLCGEGNWGEYYHSLLRVVEDGLSDNGAGLDGLPEPDFVCQQISLNRVIEHPTNNFQLVRQQFDRRREQACQAIASCPDVGKALKSSSSPVVKVLCLDATGRQDGRGVLDW